MKRIWYVVGVSIVFVLFQNFTYWSNDRTALAIIFEPEYLLVNKKGDRLTDLRGGGWHEIKTENLSDSPPYATRGKTPALVFETSLTPGKIKARSEVRVRSFPIRYQDSKKDPNYYSSFEIFIPHDEGDEFDRERSWKGDWNIIWQCAQIGAAIPHFYRDTSPPLSLQVYNRRLYLRTNNDYKKWSSDLSNETVYRKWQRKRTSSSSGKEVGDGGRIYKDLVYLGYLKKGQWNRVFMSFRLGEHGRVRTWINNKLVGHYQNPIGYRSADDPFLKNPIAGFGSNRRIKKQCSVRFGVYQGYGKPSDRSNPATDTKVLFRRFSVGSDWNAVKFGDL